MNNFTLCTNGVVALMLAIVRILVSFLENAWGNVQVYACGLILFISPIDYE